MAWANVSSRALSGIYVLLHFFGPGIRSSHRKLDRRLHLLFYLGVHALQVGGFGQALFPQPAGKQLERIALRLPALLFFLGAVVFAIDIADVMSVITICVAQ